MQVRNKSFIFSGSLGIRFLAGLLTLAFVTSWFTPLSPSLLFADPGDEKDSSEQFPGVHPTEEEAAHNDFHQAIDRLEEAGDLDKSAPPRDELPEDIKFLGTQELRFYAPDDDTTLEKVVPLDGRPLVGLPGLSPADFSKDVEYTSDKNGDFVVRLHREERKASSGFRKKKYTVELAVKGLKVQHVAVDRDYIAVLDKNNKVFAFDHALIRKNFMQSILVPRRVTSAPQLDKSKEYKIQWNHATAPFVAFADGMDPNEHLQSGDLVLFEEVNGKKKMAMPPVDIGSIEIGVFERQSALATIVPNAGEQLTPVMQLASDEKIRAEAARVKTHLEALDSSDVLYSFDSHAIADLVSTGEKTSGYLSENRHKFTQYQWLAALKAQSERENFAGKDAAFAESTASLANEQKSLIRRTLSPKNLAIAAAITSAWYFTGVGHETGVISHLEGTPGYTHVLQWKLYLYSKAANLLSLYDNMLLTDAAIRSGIVLSFVVPFTNTVGHMLSKFVNGFKNTGSAMAQCILGMRAFAQTMQIFVHGIAGFIRQPLIVEAMRHGINPFRYVRSKSYVAQEIARRKGLEAEKATGLFAGAGYGKQEDRKVAIEVMAQQREKLLSAATTIAFKIAADTEGVDPSLLLSLVDQDVHNMKDKQLQALLKDKNFNKRWFIVANKMVEELHRFRSPTDLFELRDLDPAAVEKLFLTAQKLAKKVKSYGLIRMELGMAHARWKNFWRTAMQKVGAWGFRSKEYLAKGLPSRTAVNIFYTQYTVDVQMMVWLIPLFSTRASIAHPADLAGDPDPWHHTSPNHKADMGEQVSAYLVRGAAADALEFREVEQNDRAWEYNPVYVLAEGEERHEGFLKTFYGFAKEALNLRDRAYGFRFWSNFKIRMETFNSFLFWNLISRYVLGGSDLWIHHAIAATTWTFLWRQFAYSWIWDGLNRGKQAHVNDLSAYKNKLRKARAQLMEELRKPGNEGGLLEAAKTLCGLYGEVLQGGKMDKHGTMIMNYFKNANDADLVRAHDQSRTAGVLQIEEAIGRLHEDLIINPDSIGEEERSRIRKKKIAEVDRAVDAAVAELSKDTATPADELRLNALHLLKYSQRNIPKATMIKGHEQFFWSADTVWTYFGAISTTIIGTMLFAASQHSGVPWPTKLLETAAVVSGLYFVTYNAQRIFNVAWDAVFRRPKKEAKPGAGSSGCKASLAGG